MMVFFSVSEPFPLASIFFKTIYLFTVPPPAHPPSPSSFPVVQSLHPKAPSFHTANIRACEMQNITTLEHE